MSSPSRILYVDDDTDSCELARVLLNCFDSSWLITSAASAGEALALIEEEAFDLYVLDYNLPDMSGIELCRYIRQSDADTPIMFFSALARSSEISEAKAAGANKYLLKPNDLERFPETVNRFLSKNATFSQGESPVQTKAFSGIY